LEGGTERPSELHSEWFKGQGLAVQAAPWRGCVSAVAKAADTHHLEGARCGKMSSFPSPRTFQMSGAGDME